MAYRKQHPGAVPPPPAPMDEDEVEVVVDRVLGPPHQPTQAEEAYEFDRNM